MQSCTTCKKPSQNLKRGLCLKCYGHWYWSHKPYIRNKWRAKLAREIHELLELPLGDMNRVGQKIITTVFKTLADGLKRGESVYIRGFGKFSIRTSKAHTSPNIILHASKGSFTFSKTPIEIKSKKYVHFAPCRAFTAMVDYQSPTPKSQALIHKWTQNVSE